MQCFYTVGSRYDAVVKSWKVSYFDFVVENLLVDTLENLLTTLVRPMFIL
jgi:hypothetical protein